MTILSKWPIAHKVQYVYSGGCGADALSNKGFVYVQLDVDGTPVHVVGTHVQAEDPLCFGRGAAVRAEQFATIDEFLDGLAIPSDEQVIVTGDLNVDRASPEYADLLAATDTVAPTSYARTPVQLGPDDEPARHGRAGAPRLRAASPRPRTPAGVDQHGAHAHVAALGVTPGRPTPTTPTTIPSQAAEELR